MSEGFGIVLATVQEPIAQGIYCGFMVRGSEIGFTAPIALQRGDRVSVNVADGQPFLVMRRGEGVIWEYAPNPATVTIRTMLTDEQLRQLWALFGIKER